MKSTVNRSAGAILFAAILCIVTTLAFGAPPCSSVEWFFR